MTVARYRIPSRFVYQRVAEGSASTAGYKRGGAFVIDRMSRHSGDLMLLHLCMEEGGCWHTRIMPWMARDAIRIREAIGV